MSDETEFYIGQIFEGEYPPEAADWCNSQSGVITINEIEPEGDTRRFEIVDSTPTPEEQDAIRRVEFENTFFYIEGYGWYRKQPKGYSSAMESVNTAFNAVNLAGTLPAGTLIFYTAPDFTDAEQCTEEWLVEHQTKSEAMDAAAFGVFYLKFVEAWNSSEH